GASVQSRVFREARGEPTRQTQADVDNPPTDRRIRRCASRCGGAITGYYWRDRRGAVIPLEYVDPARESGDVEDGDPCAAHRRGRADEPDRGVAESKPVLPAGGAHG